MSSYDHADGHAEEFSSNKFEESMYSRINTEMLVLDLLVKLKDRHKIVFTYLLLKDSGYKITHGDCAKTMSISRQAYMKLVKTVRIKAKKILQGKGL